MVTSIRPCVFRHRRDLKPLVDGLERRDNPGGGWQYLPALVHVAAKPKTQPSPKPPIIESRNYLSDGGWLPVAGKLEKGLTFVRLGRIVDATVLVDFTVNYDMLHHPELTAASFVTNPVIISAGKVSLVISLTETLSNSTTSNSSTPLRFL